MYSGVNMKVSGWHTVDFGEKVDLGECWIIMTDVSFW
jgi:hypothetical protein